MLGAIRASEAIIVAFKNHLEVQQPDACLAIETHLYDQTIRSPSCTSMLDIGKHLWLNRSRWTRLINEYVDPEALKRFINDSQRIYQGRCRDGATSNMLFKDPVRSEKKHRWGGCLMGVTFHGKPSPTLTLYSRTCYIGYIGFLDASIASVLAKYIADYTSMISFRWHITSQQLHCFKSLPFIYTQADLYSQLNHYIKTKGVKRKPKLNSTWVHLVKWQERILEAFNEYGADMINHEKYGPFRRVKRRWLEHEGHLHKNIPPSLKVHDLDFEEWL